MPWNIVLRPDIQDFINTHDDADIRDLALRKPPDASWPYPLIIDQIKARQKAGDKIPQWVETPGIVFPLSSVLEQASSLATARYKARLVTGQSFADLTGGCGVDAFGMSENFKSGICIEQDENTANLLAHNFKTLASHVNVQHAAAENFITHMERVDVICIDPQRRDQNRKGLFKLADCAPDVTALLPALKMRARYVIIKTSPMLDIAQTLQNLESASQVHVLEWRGECKEVVYVLDFENHKAPEDVTITAVILNDEGDVRTKLHFTRAEEARAQAEISAPMNYLYEPGPAFQKAGGFNVMAQKFGLKKLHRNTHLYTGAAPLPGFPGRSFEICGIYPVNKKELLLTQANLTLRNFPGDAESLRRKLGLKDGGENTLFACTLHDESKALIHVRKNSTK